MHLKLTKHGRFCEQDNQLPTKSHDELKDNSNDHGTWGPQKAYFKAYIIQCHAPTVL